MKKNRWKSNVESAPWRVFFLVSLVAAGAVAVQLLNARQVIRDLEVSRLQDVSRYTTENIVRQLRGLDEALKVVSESYRLSLLTASIVTASRQLEQLTDIIQSVNGLAVYDANGNAVASNNPADIGRDFYSKDFFTGVRLYSRIGEVYLSRPEYDNNQQVSVHLSRPVFDAAGNFSGAVSASLDDDFFAFTIRSSLFASDMRATLAHSDGEIFVTVPAVSTQKLVNVSTPGSAFLKHVSENQITSVFEGLIQATGQNRLLVLTSVQPVGVALNSRIVFAVSRDRNAVYAPWFEQVRVYVGSYVAIFTVAALVLALALKRRKKYRSAQAASRRAAAVTAARLERALDGGQLGLWEFKVNSHQITLDERGANLLGYDRVAINRSSEAWNDCLHPADRGPNAAAFLAHFKGLTSVYEREFRIEKNGGEYIWLFSRGKVTERKSDGTPLTVVGTFMDITARKVSEAALAEAVLLQKRSGEIAKIGGWTIEIPSGITRWNDEVYRIHALPEGESLDLSIMLGFFTSESRAEIEQAILAALEHGQSWDLELRIVSATEKVKWVRIQGEPIFDGNLVLRLSGAIQDVTETKEAAIELERLNQTLLKLSHEDALTGIGNRRLFDVTLAAEWARNARQRSTLSLLMIDIDYFKRYNDNYGHQAGDECLIRVASIISSALLRSHENAMRYGGEEFAVLLPETSVGGAYMVAQRIIEDVSKSQIEHNFSPISKFVSLSIGVAGFLPSSLVKPAKLVSLADTALYEAKAQGRARVVVVGPSAADKA